MKCGKLWITRISWTRCPRRPLVAIHHVLHAITQGTISVINVSGPARGVTATTISSLA